MISWGRVAWNAHLVALGAVLAGRMRRVRLGFFRE